MSAYTIQWRAAQVNDLASEKYAHFFAFLNNNDIVFIGNAFQQSLKDVVIEQAMALSLDLERVNIQLGRIFEYGKQAIGVDRVQNIHELLVFARKPKLNSTGKYRYLGGSDFSIQNKGCDLLPQSLREQNRLAIVGK